MSVELDAFSGHPAPILDIQCTERLFELGTCRVRVVLEDAPEGERLLGVDASVRIQTELGERAWHGIVTSVGLTPRPNGQYVVRLDVRPRFALLELGRDSRLFQHRTAQQIVDDVFVRAGMPRGTWTWSIAESLPVHRNVHQQAESDYDFVRRLLAEEGLSFAIENDDAGSRMHIFDSLDALRPVAEVDALEYRGVGVGGRDGLLELEEEHRVTSGSVALQDTDIEHPRDLERARASASEGPGPQVYMHPAGFEPRASQPLRTRRATRVLEALRRDRRVLRGRSGVMFLEPGKRCLVQGHERVDLNESLLFVEVVHRSIAAEVGGSIDYSNELVALADEVMPRPDHVMPVAPSRGLEPGIVTAPAGQEHMSDDLGRVRVRFRWDRSGSDDAQSSAWCRVAQPQLPRPQVIPRAGFEVDLDFEQGDGDRPTIVGHRYNDERLVPYPLPAHAAQSAWQSATLTSGPLANELRFDDTQGAEEVYFHASMNARAVVRHDAVRRVVQDERVQTGIRRALTVTRTYTEAIERNLSTTVGRNLGLWVGRNLADAVGEQERTTCARRRVETGGDLTETVRGDLTRIVGPLQIVAGLSSFGHRTLGDASVRVGTAVLDLVGGSKMLSVRGDLTEEVSALKLVEAGAYRVVVTSSFESTYAELRLETQTDRTDHATQDARLASDADLTLNAEHVSVTGTDQLSISAGSCEIVLAASGEITLRAPRVNLRNADAIGSIVEVN
ncbi:MAG: type VI secretion system tip protein VgrG [Myxococcales bacterium]|nr:type VI secretion system tip protein VgrG [Myxococcales bacterium]